ncbi:MAG: SRPBCC family protein [Chloroflexota bacterium]|nr:MAG: SRPBCC family protein [Chloroflexota bacterium]
MIVEDSIHINASREKIWPYLTEPEKILQWYLTFKKFEFTSEQHEGKGTTFHVEEKAGPLPVTAIDFKSNEWVENEIISFAKISEGGVKKYHQWWTIAPENSGSKFTLKEEIEFPYGFIGRLIELVGKGSSQSTIKIILSQLRQLVESD